MDNQNNVENEEEEEDWADFASAPAHPQDQVNKFTGPSADFESNTTQVDTLITSSIIEEIEVPVLATKIISTSEHIPRSVLEVQSISDFSQQEEKEENLSEEMLETGDLSTARQQESGLEANFEEREVAQRFEDQKLLESEARATPTPFVRVEPQRKDGSEDITTAVIDSQHIEEAKICSVRRSSIDERVDQLAEASQLESHILTSSEDFPQRAALNNESTVFPSNEIKNKHVEEWHNFEEIPNPQPVSNAELSEQIQILPTPLEGETRETTRNDLKRADGIEIEGEDKNEFENEFESESDDWAAFASAPVPITQNETRSPVQSWDLKEEFTHDLDNDVLIENESSLVQNKDLGTEDEEDEWNAFEGSNINNSAPEAVAESSITNNTDFTFEADFDGFESSKNNHLTQTVDAAIYSAGTSEFEISDIEGIDSLKALLGLSSLKRDILYTFLPILKLSSGLFNFAEPSSSSAPLAVPLQPMQLESPGTNILHPWSSSDIHELLAFGRDAYCCLLTAAQIPWLFKEVEGMLAENIPTDALPLDQLKSNIRKDFSITQEHPGKGIATAVSTAQNDKLTKIVSSANKQEGMEAIEDPISLRSQGDDRLQSNVLEESDPSNDFGNDLNIQELSPIAYQYLRNLPDLSFVI